EVLGPCGPCPAEAEFPLVVDRHQMDMGMGNFEAGRHHADTTAGNAFLEGAGDFSGERKDAGKEGLIEGEKLVDFLLWNDESVSRRNGINIEEGQKTVVLDDFFGGNLPPNDEREKGGHDYGIPLISLRGGAYTSS